MRKQLLIILSLSLASFASAQEDSTKNKVKLTGTMGVTYENYGLTMQPAGSNFYSPRRPWNQARFQFTPVVSFGKYFSLPFNFNFSTLPTNFAGPYAGIVKQNFGQWLTNPLNSFGLNPTYKWAELQLGTQYLKYSNLSTGDIGVFGAGIDLKPQTWRFKFFTGTSQRGINYAPTPLPGVAGAYQRQHWMAQIGNEKEDKYLLALNFAKANDKTSSVTSPPQHVQPQEGLTISLVADVYFGKGWYVRSETARSTFTDDMTAAALTPSTGSPGSSTGPGSVTGSGSSAPPEEQDWAATASIGKKSANFDIGYSSKYVGEHFRTLGYPFMQFDYWDNTLDTRFNAWKSQSGAYRVHVVASAGQRINRLSDASARSRQFIANLNWLTQFNDHVSVNITYNNFGFQSASITNPTALRNVSNDFGVNPTFTWSSTKVYNFLSINYNYSKYVEKDYTLTPFPLVTPNNTHSLLLSYVPTFLQKNLTPDFSVLYFENRLTGFATKLFTLGAGISMPLAKDKVQFHGQLQYSHVKNNFFTPSDNLIGSLTIDWKITKKLTWNNFFTTNFFKYGDELAPPANLMGAHYLETHLRTGLRYRF